MIDKRPPAMSARSGSLGRIWNSPGKTGVMFVRDRPPRTSRKSPSGMLPGSSGCARPKPSRTSANSAAATRTATDMTKTLGSPCPSHPVPGPESKVAYRLDQPDNPVLDYTNFSIVMNKDRRQALLYRRQHDGSQTRASSERRVDHRRTDSPGRSWATRPTKATPSTGDIWSRNDPAWGSRASQVTTTPSPIPLHRTGQNQKEWLALEDTSGLGQGWAENDRPDQADLPRRRPQVRQQGAVKPPTQIISFTRWWSERQERWPEGCRLRLVPGRPGASGPQPFQGDFNPDTSMSPGPPPGAEI